MNNIKHIFIALLWTASFSSCVDLDVTPYTAADENTAEKTYDGLKAMVNGLHHMTYYYQYGHYYGTGQAALNFLYDMIGNDFFNSKPAYMMPIYRWQEHTNPDGSLNYYSWDYYSTLVLHANRILIGVETLQGVDEKNINRIKGEAHAYRAYAYHQLVQLFGKRFIKGEPNDGLGVVLRLGDNQYGKQERATVAETYAQINKDIKAALEELSKATPASGKNSISYATACGIAMRIALTQEEWADAEWYAEQGIESAVRELNVRLQVGEELINGFNDWNSPEWMWAYKSAPDQDQGYISFFVTASYNFRGYNRSIRFAVNRTIYDKMGEKDVRRKFWICEDRGDKIPADAYDLYFNSNDWEVTGQSIKYKAQSAVSSKGDVQIMRVAELYYGQAEAEYRQGKETEAQATLNAIMKTRDADYEATAYTSTGLWEEIYRNKRIDLWGEGLRFFDMKRLKEVPDRLKDCTNKNYLTGTALQMAVSRNSGDNVKYMALSVDDPAWQFAIPKDELTGNTLCQPNQLKTPNK